MVITRDKESKALKGSSQKRKREERDKETKVGKSQKTESSKSNSSTKKGKSPLQPTSKRKANSSKDAKVKAKEAKLHKTEVSEVDTKAKPKRNVKNSKSSELKSEKKSNKSSHAKPIFFKENIRYKYYNGQTLYGRININSRTTYLREIENSLTPASWKRILDGPFGRIVKMAQQVSYSCQTLHVVIYKQLETQKKWESWYEIGGKELRFSLKEYALISGLGCGEIPAVRTNGDNTVMKRFFGVPKITVQNLFDMFIEYKHPDNYKLKMALLLIVEGVILGGDKKRFVKAEHVKLFDNMDNFYDYPWGRAGYEELHKSLTTALSSRMKTLEKAKLKSTVPRIPYSLQGMPLIFQIWVYEAVPTFGLQYSNVLRPSARPRGMRWFSEDAPEHSILDVALADTTNKVNQILHPEDHYEEMLVMDAYYANEDDDGHFDNIVNKSIPNVKGKKPADPDACPSTSSNDSTKVLSGLRDVKSMLQSLEEGIMQKMHSLEKRLRKLENAGKDSALEEDSEEDEEEERNTKKKRAHVSNISSEEEDSEEDEEERNTKKKRVHISNISSEEEDSEEDEEEEDSEEGEEEDDDEGVEEESDEEESNEVESEEEEDDDDGGEEINDEANEYEEGGDDQGRDEESKKDDREEEENDGGEDINDESNEDEEGGDDQGGDEENVKESAHMEVNLDFVKEKGEEVANIENLDMKEPTIGIVSKEAQLRAERAAVERATAEARERAMEKAQLRTDERVAKALAEKNMRDLIAQREQEERNRVSETLEADIKRWSNGKEGNLPVLLSTLEYIIGSDSGWQPIPITELITSDAVKKAYRKATLCVHPEKLQQRGATIQQIYKCEKVFDLLKDAWECYSK